MISEEYEPDGNKMILDFLGIDDSSLAPCFVLFTWDDRNNLVSTAYKFNFGTVDEVHNELRGLIEAISNAERHILPEYKRNIETYIQARDAADAYLAEKIVKRIKKAILPNIKSLLMSLLND